MRPLHPPPALLALLAGLGGPSVLGLLAGLAAPAGLGAQGAAEAPAWTAKLEESIPRWMDKAGVPGLNALVLEGGRVVWAASFGEADPGSGRPLTRDGLFRVESISKPVTAWGVLRLVEEGRLDLDAPVAAHLGRWRPPPETPPFTLRQLLSHTAGLGIGDYTDRHPAGGPVPDLRASLAREFRVQGTPGGAFSYSDTGYNLAEALVEDVVGEPFAPWMAREILGPLGMNGASYDWRPELADRVPVGHTLRGDPVEPYVYPGRGSGGLFATIDDLARFLQAGMAASFRPPQAAAVLADSTLALLHAPQAQPRGLFGLVADGYALGHFTETLGDGRLSVWHGGQGYGWMTHAQWVPETGDGILLLANSQRAWPLFGQVLRAWSEALGVEPVGMSRVTLARPLALGAMALLLLLVGIEGRRVAKGALGGARIGVAPGRRRPAVRVLQAALGVALVGGVAWGSAQEYLFLFSILPGLVGWLGAALLAAGGVLVVSAASR